MSARPFPYIDWTDDTYVQKGQVSRVQSQLRSRSHRFAAICSGSELDLANEIRKTGHMNWSPHEYPESLLVEIDALLSRGGTSVASAAIISTILQKGVSYRGYGWCSRNTYSGSS